MNDIEGKSSYRFSNDLVKSMSNSGFRVEDIIHEDKTKSYLNAYKCKSELKKNDSKSKLEAIQNMKIYTHSPIMASPEGKFTHKPSALITPISPHKSSCQLNSSPTKRSPMSHSHADSVHHKLSSAEHFPHTYKKKFDENSVDVSGNYIADPRKAISLLKSTSSAKLTIPGRAADFTSEVHWRMQLRNGD